MDLVIAKKDLLRLVARRQGVADKKSAMPALANVLLAAEGNTLRVSATDLYLSVSGQTHAEVATAGSVAVPAKDLPFERRAMPDGPVQIIATEGAQTTLKAVGSPRYTLHGIPAASSPALVMPDAPSLQLPVDLLALLIARTHFSISSDETRPHVNSGLFGVGRRPRPPRPPTDGHRLSKMEATVTGSLATATMLIPLKAITELRRLAEESKGEKDAELVTITQSGPNAFFSIAGMVFSVKLVDAQFPPYQQAATYLRLDCSVRAPRLQLSDALRAVSLAASDRTGGVKLSVAPGTLRITSESQRPRGDDRLQREVLDVLSAVEGEEIVLGISGELDPAVLRPAAETNDQSYVKGYHADAI